MRDELRMLVEAIVREAISDELAARIGDLLDEPHMSSIESFVEHKIDDEEDTYDHVELQALAKLLWLDDGGDERGFAPKRYIDQAKAALASYGLVFRPREPERHVRGAMSNPHGRHPFAGSGGGGTGFGNAGFSSHGGGPGAMGAGYDWKSGDAKNLPMGTGRRKR